MKLTKIILPLILFGSLSPIINAVESKKQSTSQHYVPTKAEKIKAGIIAGSILATSLGISLCVGSKEKSFSDKLITGIKAFLGTNFVLIFGGIALYAGVIDPQI